MKKNSRLLCIVSVAMVLSIAFSGVTLASQTSFDCIVSNGTVHVDTSSSSSTQGVSSNYDSSSYKLNIWGIQGDSKITHLANLGESIEAQTSVMYAPSPSLVSNIFLDEHASTSRISKVDNASFCCDSSVKTRGLATLLNYETATSIDNNWLSFALDSAGSGSLDVLTEETRVAGNLNGSWTSTRSSDSMAVNGLFNMTAGYMSDSCEYPTLAQAIATPLCSFFTP